MRSPVLVTPPSGEFISLTDMRAHLRVDGTEEDPLTEMLMAAAVAYLDGWKGVLGRAILPQTWRETFTCPGPYRLSMPDVISTVITVDGETVTGALTVDALGPLVSLAGSPSEVVIDYTCGLPAQQLASARVAVMLLVGHWFATREAVTPGSMAEVPMSASMLISALRWRSV